MKVFVTVESFQGVIDTVQVRKSFEGARLLELAWLDFHGIKCEDDRECKGDDGTAFLIFEYDLND